MTRTFVVGEVSQAVAAQEVMVRRALDAVQPGVSGGELSTSPPAMSSKLPGFRPSEPAPPGATRMTVSVLPRPRSRIEVQEELSLRLAGDARLVAGDVIALEPGLWQAKIVGVRFEDLVLVTAKGGETLTDCPYDLAP